ncbi:MAG: hypothetical protein ACI4J5_03850 [Oscillospiraceae bacterium]
MKSLPHSGRSRWLWSPSAPQGIWGTGPLFCLCSRILSPPTVFSLDRFTVEIDGREYSSADIEYIKLTREISGLPVKGIITAKLNIRLRADEPFAPGTEIRITDDLNSRELPVFCISKPDYGGGIAELTAYDNCRALDLIFDTDSLYFSEDRDYPVFDVVNSAAAQCGFAGAAFGELNVSAVPYKYLKGKTCRSILNMLSETGCGVWYCNNQNQLEFQKFGVVTDFYAVDDSSCSDLRTGPVKGPVTAIQVSNPMTDENYQLGYYGSFINKLKVSGRLIDSNAASGILSDVIDKEYRAFTCKNVFTSVIPEAFSGFVYNDVCYRAASIVTYFSPVGYFSSVKAPVIAEDRYDYVGTLDYSIGERIMQEKKYGCSVMSLTGLKFSDEDTSYGFSSQSGGLTTYEGVMSSSKEASSVAVDKSSGTVTVTYSDGHVYKYSAAVTETSSGYNITNETEEWT